MPGSFERFFRSSELARDRYLSRIFGIFSEEIVRIWCSCNDAPYEDLGRPTLYAPGDIRGHTIDFTLKNKRSGELFVAEMKSELEYEKYRYLRLECASQIVHHKSVAFGKFLSGAKNPTALLVRCNGKPIDVRGSILIWGALTPEGKASAISEYGFADVLSAESMIEDIQIWKPVAWHQFTNRRRQWSNELFDFMDGMANRRSND